MDALLHTMLSVTLAVFLIGSLLEVGLKLDVGAALRALRNVRFMALSVVWGYALCPALAWTLTKVMPLPQAYADGMLFLSLAPCAPFFPMAAQKAKGDLAYMAAFTLLTSVCTVIYMPLVTPWLVSGLAADAWLIARPLIFLILAPMILGAALRLANRTLAEKIHPVCRKATLVAIVFMLGLVLWIYRADLTAMVGTWAIATQLLFYSSVTAASYLSASGLPHSQKSVLALGVSTRNIGAAIAPLLAIPGTDPRTIAMAVMAVPVTVVCAFGAAPLLARLQPAEGKAGS